MSIKSTRRMIPQSSYSQIGELIDVLKIILCLRNNKSHHTCVRQSNNKTKCRRLTSDEKNNYIYKFRLDACVMIVAPTFKQNYKLLNIELRLIQLLCM